MWTVPLGGTTCVIDNSLNLGINKIPFPFKASPKSLRTSGLCRASQVAELFPTISPEVYVREARVEDCWEVAETHCSSFFPEYSFPLDFVLRIDRLIAMLFGFSIPIGCQRTCLVAVVGSRDEEACLLGTEELKLGGFDGRLSLNKGYVTGVLTVDTVADFLPRKGPLRQRRYIQMSRRFVRRCFSRIGELHLLLECCRVRVYVCSDFWINVRDFADRVVGIGCQFCKRPQQPMCHLCYALSCI